MTFFHIFHIFFHIVHIISVNKPGECPQLGNNTRCDRECYTDADCREDNKCCTAGCGFVCVSPAGNTTETTEPPKPHYPGGKLTKLFLSETICFNVFDF